MKKTIYLSVMALAISLAGCNNDDDNTSNALLVGTWKSTENHDEYFNGKDSVHEESKEDDEETFSQLEFKSDGTVIEIDYEEGVEVGSSESTYTRKGDKITFRGSDGETLSVTFSVKDDILTIVAEEEEEDEIDGIAYDRIVHTTTYKKQ